MNTATELWSYRNLILNLAQRELRSRYKKSVLGWLWSLINPLSTLMIYSLVFGVFLAVAPPVAGNGHTRVFAFYLFAALIVWNYFSATVNGAIGALQSAGPLLNKVYFPPACPAIANWLTVLLQASIEAGILVFVMALVGNVGITYVLFPVLVMFLGLFSIGVGLIVSVYNVRFRDVGYLVGIAMNFLFYSTPIVYTIDNIPKEKGGIPVRAIFELNPLAQFVGWSRDAFYLLRWPSAASFFGTAAVSIVVFALGTFVFARRAADIAEEL